MSLGGAARGWLGANWSVAINGAAPGGVLCVNFLSHGRPKSLLGTENLFDWTLQPEHLR